MNNINNDNIFDLIIIGGGPGGVDGAIKASKNGLKTLLIEKNELGGTCLNHGCIPTKSYYASSDLINRLKNCASLGINANYSFDFSKIKSRKDEVVKALNEGTKFSLEKSNVTVIKGIAKIHNSEEKIVKVNDDFYKANNIIIATGSKELLIPIKGNKKLLTSTDLLDLETLPKSLTIIGGGVIGVEFASILKLLGVETTIIELQKTILPNLDSEIVRRLTNYLKQLGVKIITNSKVIEVSDDKLIYVTNDKEVEIEVDEVMLSVGRIPNISDLGLDNVNINYDKKGIIVNDNFETNVKGIYAIGDCIGKMMLAHFASASGEKVIDVILNKPNFTNFNLIPSVVFTFPEVASIGLTEDYLKENNIDYISNKYLYRANGKALASGETDGFIKVLVKDDKIIGTHIIGSEASLLIHEAMVVMNANLKITEVSEYIFAHPTLSEIFKSSIRIE